MKKYPRRSAIRIGAILIPLTFHAEVYGMRYPAFWCKCIMLTVFMLLFSAAATGCELKLPLKVIEGKLLKNPGNLSDV